MKKTLFALAIAAVFIFTLYIPDRSFAVDQNKILQESYQVLDTMTGSPNPTIPPDVLNHAQGIAIFPDYTKGGLVVGGGHGNGVLLTRTSSGGWSDPVFVSMSGGSLGAQIGLKVMDVVMVFQNQEMVHDVLQQKFGVAAGSSVNAGQHTYYENRWDPQRDIRIYTSSNGLYAGAVGETAGIRMNHDANASFYNDRSITPEKIIAGQVRQVPAQAQNVKHLLQQRSS